MSKSPQDSDIYAQLAARDNQPEPLKKVLAREQANYDCLSCRVMGVLYLLLFPLPSFFVFLLTLSQEQRHSAPWEHIPTGQGTANSVLVSKKS
jgi:hypothetical protein